MFRTRLSISLLMAVVLGLPWLFAPARGYDEHGDEFSYTITNVAESFGYSTIALPDSVLICQIVEGEHVTCLRVLPGSILLVPHPQSAPVDSLPKDSTPDTEGEDGE